MSKASKKQQYVKMDPISHILERSDMYVGSTKSRFQEEYVVSGDDYRITQKKIDYSPAILRVFIEPLSNVIDNVARSKKAKKSMTKICVDVDQETGETSFWNDGDVIPIEIHTEEKCYNHTLIFGNLLTSSNYDDEEERYDISGRNGLGVKLANVFSSTFKVRGMDPKNKKLFSQTWTNNMKDVSNPDVKTSDLKKGFTQVTYTPDFKQFNLEGYTDDIISLYKKYVVDMAMLTKVPVYFNGELIPVENLVDYSKLYLTEDTQEVLHIKTKDCEVVLTPAVDFQAISFANGVYTPLGGTHVDAWSEKLFRPLVEKLNKPKKPQISIKDVKQCFRLFVVASVVNPKYDSQSKLKLEEPTIEAEVKKTHITALSKWSVMERLEDIIRAKEFVVLKKAERKKRGYTKVEGLDSANNEGGKNAHLCTLILVEGLSAKTYAVSGIEVGAFGRKGRDFWGIYPLRGKVLNVRNATATSIAKNHVVTDIIQALGLRQNLDYTDESNYKTLRYGKIMTICDADDDGVHIGGLIQNLFHTLFPSLLQRTEPFLTSMQTPIVRVFLSKTKSLLFYDEREYKKYVKKNSAKQINHKYYKGLGTSDDAMVKETFGKKIVELVNDEHSSENMNKAFHKKYTDVRKEWLANYDPENVKLSWKGEGEEVKRLKISDFINTELIKFSISDCARSIPHILDGLKESQRKILYVAFKKKLNYNKKTMKVAQFGAQVALHSGYHHGEQNLYDTIVKMAQCYPGSNNIPLFFRDGQFGTRNSNGRDAASARYIFTKLDMLTRLIFHPDDDELLTHCEDDGDVVEPQYYVPILPMILVNGSAGIGTAWSSNVPNYNPEDLINAIKIWLQHDGKVMEKDENDENTYVSLLPELTPWYREWYGTIEPSGDGGRFTSFGVLTEEKEKFVVSELPIGMSTDSFRDKLDTWKEEKQIVNYKNYSTPKTVNFIITESKDGFACSISNMKLTSYLYTSNMVMFTEDGLRKFNSVYEIIDYYCTKRLEFYVKRKANLLNKIEEEIIFLGNKRRFMEEVISGDIKVFKQEGKKKVARPTKELVTELEERKYDKILKKRKNNKIEEEEDDKDEGEEENEKTVSDHGYGYLLSMQIRSITAEKIDKLRNDLESSIKRKKEIESKSEKEMYLVDLESFEVQYKVFINSLSSEKVKIKRKKKE